MAPPSGAAGTVESVQRASVEPQPCVLLDGHPVRATTRVSEVGAYVLCLSTALPDLGIDFHSTYTGHAGTETQITELLLAGGVAHSLGRTRPHEELPVVAERRRCLLDHLARLRERLEQQSRLAARIETKDETLVPFGP